MCLEKHQPLAILRFAFLLRNSFLIQDLLLKLYPRLEEMKGIEKLGAWMARILYRMYIDRIRRDKRSPIQLIENEEAVYETYESTQPGPLEEVDSSLTLTIINEALHRLSDDHRLLIILHDVEGHNLQEIHEITGLPLGTIKSRISRARSKLREIISKKEPYVLETVTAGTRL